MLFPTLNFALFFLVVFTVSWTLNRYHRGHKLFLLAASYFFYGFWDWRFTFLLFFSSLMNYLAGRLLDRSPNPKTRKITVAAAVTLNLLILVFFKYYGFFIESLADILYALQWERDLPFLEIILPVGISFFTFQGISYVVDVYRGQVEGSRSLLNVALYISFFPQLVAGPIVRASYFLPQLERKPDINHVFGGVGVLLIVWGVFKKAIVANYLAVEMVDDIFFDPTVYGPVDLILGLYGYSIQIYCDFSAYSDIAIGVAALLGYRFPKNFDQPYRSASLTEFWRRWHISLSTWLRDYLYIPLGGNRHGTGKTYRNLFMTMFLGGLWHGAGWNFVLWGSLHGLGLCWERLIRVGRGIDRREGILKRFLMVFLTLNLVSLAWVLFRAPSMDIVWKYLVSFTNYSTEIQNVTPFIISLLVLGFTMHFTPSDTLARVESGFVRLPPMVQGLIAGIFLVAIESFGREGIAPFIYFQF